LRKIKRRFDPARGRRKSGSHSDERSQSDMAVGPIQDIAVLL
jgi:hypothetical protein